MLVGSLLTLSSPQACRSSSLSCYTHPVWVMLCLQVLQYAIPKHRTVQGASTATAGQQVQEQEPQASTSTCSFMQAADQALPAELLQHLQHVFRPDAPFWRQHAYGRVGYFSYFFPLVRTGGHTGNPPVHPDTSYTFACMRSSSGQGISCMSSIVGKHHVKA